MNISRKKSSSKNCKKCYPLYYKFCANPGQHYFLSLTLHDFINSLTFLTFLSCSTIGFFTVCLYLSTPFRTFFIPFTLMIGLEFWKGFLKANLKALFVNFQPQGLLFLRFHSFCFCFCVYDAIKTYHLTFLDGKKT